MSGRDRTLAGIAGGLALPVWLGFGMPLGDALLCSLAVVALARFAGPVNALVGVASAAVSLGIYAAALAVSGLDDAIYYRPHERYSTWNAELGHKSYEPRLRTQVRVAHGDLQVMTREPIAEPRVVRFETDSAGFRNADDFAGQSYVAVGDSFIAGNGTSQEQLLTAQLGSRGVSTYNLGFPGGIEDYESYLESFRERHGYHARALLFLFEGNDFPERAGRAGREERWLPGRWLKIAVRDVTRGFTALPTSRMTRSLLWRIARADDIAEGELVDVRKLAGRAIAFYKPYVENSRRKQLDDMARFDAAFARLAGDLHAVFLIPTKYRVYHRWLDDGTRLATPQWDHLRESCRDHGVACFDLTPVLASASSSLLDEGAFSWWRDDTHWNGRGIAAASATVAEVLRGRSVSLAETVR